MQSHSIRALAALAFTVFVWGITPVFVRGISLALGPYDALVMRLCISSMIFALLLALTVGFHFPRTEWGQLARVSFFGLLAYYSFSVFGFTFAPAGIGTLIMSSQPILIGLLAWLVGVEKITPMTVLGLLISFAGSVYLITGDDLGLTAAAKSDLLLGCGLIVLASIGWAYFVVFSRDLSRKHGALKITGLSNIIIVLPALPFVRWDMGQKLLNMPIDAKWGLLFLSTIGTVSVITWNYAAPHLRPTVLGAGLYVMPIIAILAGWALRNEAVTFQIVGAAAIILAGVAVAQMKWQR